MNLPLCINSQNLLAKPIQTADAEVVFHSWSGDTQVAKYLVWRNHSSIDETKKYIQGCIEKYRAGVESTYIAWSKNETQALGCISLRPKDHMVEVGYLVRRSHWGRGLCTELLRATMQQIFTSTCYLRIWAHCDIDNKASARVMEKSGMHLEGTLRCWAIHPNISSIPRDVLVYSRLAHEK